MKVLQKQLKLEGAEYYAAHLSIVNSFLKVRMTEKEVEVLSAFFNLDRAIIEEDMFNTLARKMVKEQLGDMTAGALSNHLKSLIEKGFIDKHSITNKLTVKPYLIPEEKMQGYQFKIYKK